jgi:phage I-like protein
MAAMPSLFPVLLPPAGSNPPGGGSPGRSRSGLALSACAFVGADGRLVASERVQLLPAGEFRSLDGRPQEVSAWFIDGSIAGQLIAEAQARATPYVLDYHHQSLLASESGIKAPAAGWFKTLEWIDGVGLFATDLQWTAAARQMVEADEFRYLSPVFAWDRATGKVTHLINAALTNTPGLDGMAAVADRVAAQLEADGLSFTALESPMDDLLDRIRYFLNLPITATAEDCTAELQKLIDQVSTVAASEPAAAGLSLGSQLVAALQRQPDASEYIPAAVHAALQNELAAARATIEDSQRSLLMDTALSDGRILPATQAYWQSQPLAALTAYLEIAQPVAALAGMQSGGRVPETATAPMPFAVPAGYHVDVEQLAQHSRILAHAGEHGMPYHEAAAALDRR